MEIYLRHSYIQGRSKKQIALEQQHQLEIELAVEEVKQECEEKLQNLKEEHAKAIQKSKY